MLESYESNEQALLERVAQLEAWLDLSDEIADLYPTLYLDNGLMLYHQVVTGVGHCIQGAILHDKSLDVQRVIALPAFAAVGHLLADSSAQQGILELADRLMNRPRVASNSMLLSSGTDFTFYNITTFSSVATELTLQIRQCIDIQSEQ